MQADSNDPDGVGFVQWRVAWYVGGEDGACVLNTLALWDDFLVARCKAMAKVVRLVKHNVANFTKAA